MTSNPPPARPPRVSAWLVELFASPDEAEGIVGDLAEDFSATVQRAGEAAARRTYRHQASLTIRDLALYPLRTQPATSAAIVCFGLSLAGGLALPGFGAARALVTHYPIYHYIPASLFWAIVDMARWLLAGFIIAMLAPVIRLRPMSAAVALIAMTAVWLALDRPVLLWLYGRPMAARITFARWANGVLICGGATLLGAVLARQTMRGGPAPFDAVANRGASLLRSSWLPGVLIGTTLLVRYLTDLLAPIQYTPGVIPLRARVMSQALLAILALTAARTAWRTDRVRIALVVTIASGFVGAWISIAGTTALLVVWHDPATMRAWQMSGGIGEALYGVPLFVLPTIATVVGTAGAFGGKYLVRPLLRLRG